MKTILSTEKTSDLNAEILKRFDVRTTNLIYYINDVEHVSDKDFDAEEFYGEMRADAKVSTSQVNAEMAEEYLRKLTKEGDVLHIAFSSGLSGTCQSMISAAKIINAEGGNKVRVVDSLAASVGQGLLVYMTAEKLASGATLDEAADYAESIKLNICHIFTVSDLKYLQRGGRISKTTQIVGNILNIKPVMHMDDEGHLVPMKKVFGRRKAVNSLCETMLEKYNGMSKTVFICEADCMEDALRLTELIREKTGLSAQIMELNPVIGAHSGPGTISLFFTGTSR